MERRRIHTIAQSGRLRPIVEHMPQVSTTPRARHLGPPHSETRVGGFPDFLLIERCVKTRPAASRIEFRLRIEKLVAAAYAQVNSLAMEVPVLAREGTLRALSASDLVLLRGEKSPPFFVRLFHFFAHHIFLLAEPGRNRSLTGALLSGSR